MKISIRRFKGETLISSYLTEKELIVSLKNGDEFIISEGKDGRLLITPVEKGGVVAMEELKSIIRWD